ncbi:MAG: FtsW/RodA/SpoVE family cell cycle protein [Leptospiraceae bacterium]|nr:FtsW/RodA/SpoVE family cell cycle protein [Leptospiraceae bacterium]NUM41764.1 FtsW/RodA/SpoVE family cell cycle protein [Leptospiraceae bacterium]
MYSSSAVTAEREFNDPMYFLKKQFVWICISLVVYISFSLLPYNLLQKFAIYIAVFSVFLLVLVFLPGVGKSVSAYYGRNFHRWIGIGPFQYQPSEFSKLAMVIYLSAFLVKIKSNQVKNYKIFLFPSLLVGIELVLIIAEPAFGTTMAVIFVIVTLIFLDGFPLKNLIISLVAMIPLMFILVDKVGYRKKRIEVWLDPYKYRFDEGHQLVSSFRAFSDGGLFGNPISLGYSHRYLTYSHTDFVMATFVEDYGFLGFIILLSLFLLLIIRAFYLIKKVKDLFGFYLGVGIITMFSIQILINLFVVTGVFPITGISLPFISYGGSSILTMMVSLGILTNITRKENLT